MKDKLTGNLASGIRDGAVSEYCLECEFIGDMCRECTDRLITPALQKAIDDTNEKIDRAFSEKPKIKARLRIK
jgi:hypothetical protein